MNELSETPVIRVPSDDAPWFPAVNEFALTFNAYERLGSLEKTDAVARFGAKCYAGNGSFPDNLDLVRSCLFFEQRRYHHLDVDPYDEPQSREYLKALLRKIREMSGGVVLGPPDAYP